MVNMTIAIPEKLHDLLKKHRDVKWSEVARNALLEKAKDLELLDKLASKSKLTMEDVMELDEVIKEGLMKTLIKKGIMRAKS